MVVKKNRPPIHCGEVKVEFIARTNVQDIPTIQINTPRGYARVSGSEATAFDIIGYPGHCGWFSNIATILHELAEKLDRSRLAEVSRYSPLPWAQRLGYLLERFTTLKRIEPLHKYVSGWAKEYVPLRPGGKTQGAPRDERWKLLVNDAVEPDL